MKSKEQKRVEAEERKEVYGKLTNPQKLEKAIKQTPYGGAKKVIVKLGKKINEEQTKLKI